MKRALLLSLTCTSLVLAADPVATLTASKAKINGKILPATGAPNWPVAAQDDISTEASAALKFSTGVVVKLAPDTSIWVLKPEGCTVTLNSGSLKFTKPEGVEFTVCKDKRRLALAALPKGSVAVDPSGTLVSGGAGMSAGTKAAIAAGAGGAATVATVAKVNPRSKKDKDK